MPLDPDIAAVLRLVNDQPPMTQGPIAEMRKARERKGQYELVPVDQVEDLTIPGPAGGIAARFYAHDAGDAKPLLIFFHGGGFVFGSLDGYYDHVCRHIARETAAAVLSVDYRLAPENKFPAATDDCYAALLWVGDNLARLRGDPARLLIGGGSAGGNLAAATALRIRDQGGPRLAGQVLLYPVTDYHTPPSASYLECAEGYYLSRADMIWFWSQYLEREKDAANPYAAPMKAVTLEGLPPALIITAEYDPLRDEAEAYARRMQSSGIPVQLSRYDGMIHGFLAFKTQAAPRFYAELREWISRL